MVQKTQAAEVVAIRHLAPDVREMVLRPTDHPIPFQPGQWISVHLPIGAKPLVRAYTMAEPASDDGTLVLCFDRVKEGAASTYLFGLEEGTRIDVASAALGNFTLPAACAQAFVFVAWFTGVVPFRCMLLDLERRGAEHDTLVIYGAPNANELVYHEEISAMAARHPWLQYAPLGHRPQDRDRKIEDLLEAIPAAMDRAFGPRAGTDGLHPMICGIRAMVLPARAWFMERYGFDRTQIQKETYD